MPRLSGPRPEDNKGKRTVPALSAGRPKTYKRKPKSARDGTVVPGANLGPTERWYPADEDAELVSEALARRWTKGRIKYLVYELAGRALGKKIVLTDPATAIAMDQWFHHAGHGTIEDLLNRARKKLMERFSLDPKMEKGYALEFYSSVIRSETSTEAERIRAQERIDAIMGHDAKFGNNSEGAEMAAKKVREALEAIEKTISNA